MFKLNSSYLAYPVKPVIQVEPDQSLSSGIRLFIQDEDKNQNYFLDVVDPDLISSITDKNKSVHPESKLKISIDSKGNVSINKETKKKVDDINSFKVIDIDGSHICPVCRRPTLIGKRCASLVCPVNKHIVFSFAINKVLSFFENRDDFVTLLKLAHGQVRQIAGGYSSLMLKSIINTVANKVPHFPKLKNFYLMEAFEFIPSSIYPDVIWKNKINKAFSDFSEGKENSFSHEELEFFFHFGIIQLVTGLVDGKKAVNFINWLFRLND